MRPRDRAESRFQLALVTLEKQPVGGGGDAVGGTGGQTDCDCRSVGGRPDSWCSNIIKRQNRREKNDQARHIESVNRKKKTNKNAGKC